jgi:hypothetical protein
MCLASPAFGDRYIVDMDGNYLDKDDWGACAMISAVMESQGRYCQFLAINNHVPETVSSWQLEMRSSALGGSSRFGPFRVVDYRVSADNGVGQLRAAMRESTSTNKLYISLNGPAEMIWRALNQGGGVPTATRQYVTVVGHSSDYNSNSGPHKLSQCTGIKTVQIQNGNINLNTQQNWSPWAWLKTSGDPDLQWVHARMKKSGRADVSDTCTVVYILTGNRTCDINYLKAMLLP